MVWRAACFSRGALGALGGRARLVPAWRGVAALAAAAPSWALAPAPTWGGRVRARALGTQQGEAVDDFVEGGGGGGGGGASSGFFLPFKYRSKKARERYVLKTQIGSGCFATVYEALDIETNKKVAVKVMDKRATPREICERELRILDQVSSKAPNARVTPMIDVFEDATKLYFVLELMRGDLFDHVSKTGKMSEPEAATVVRKLCFTLEALHRSGILHRDIKLENLLIESRKEGESEEDDQGAQAFKVADFGFAKQMDEKDRFRNPAGTLGYAAPEVLEKREYGPATDVYSAGVVLYILLSGHPPFPLKPGVDPTKLSVEEQLSAEAEAIHYGRESKRWQKHLQKGVWKDISLGAKKLVSKMLRIDPAKRATTQEVLNDPWILANTKLRQFEFLNFE